MSRAKFLPALLLAMAACQAPATPAGLAAADDAAIRAIVKAYAPTVKSRDIEKTMAIYTADAVRLPPNAPALEHTGLKAWLEAYPTMTQFEITLDALDGSGTVAVARGKYTIALTIPGQKAPVEDKGKFIAVYTKQADGSWKCSEDIWNSDLPAPGAPPPPPKK